MAQFSQGVIPEQNCFVYVPSEVTISRLCGVETIHPSPNVQNLKAATGEPEHRSDR